MTTRIYLPSSGTPAISPAVDTGWEQSASVFARYPAVTVKSNTALADISGLFGSTATSHTCYGQWIIGPFNVDQTITGTASMVIRALEGGLTEDVSVIYWLRAIKPDLTLRGVLLADGSGIELTTSAATRSVGPTAVTSTAVLAGDYLAVEIGGFGTTPANALPITFRVGDPSATGDFALSDGLTTDLCPWVEFSQNLTFGSPTPSQDVYPAADVTLGNWTNEAGGTTALYQSVDEVTANDADYIQSGDKPVNDVVEIQLGSAGTPQAGGGTLFIRHARI